MLITSICIVSKGDQMCFIGLSKLQFSKEAGITHQITEKETASWIQSQQVTDALQFYIEMSFCSSWQFLGLHFYVYYTLILY